MAEHNRLFAIAAEEEGTAFVADREGAWRDILCVIEERVVGNDNTVAWGGRRLQLPQSRLRPALRQGQGAGARAIPTGRSRSIWGPIGWRATPRGRAHPRRPDRTQSGSVLGAVKAWPGRGASQARGRRDGQP